MSPTAVREIMLLQETQHENIVRLDSVHINREARAGLRRGCTVPVVALGLGFRDQPSASRTVFKT